jgi:division protein CdvB (Snf7/Vps24/ESCRT-III family)
MLKILETKPTIEVNLERLNNFEDVEKVLQNYKTTIQNCLDRSRIAQSKSSSANTRSNDNAKEINQLIKIVDKALTTTNYNLSKLREEIEYIKLPWYRKLMCRLRQK